MSVRSWSSLALLVTAVFGASSAAQPPPRPSKLFKDSRAHLADAVANERPTVTLVVATEPGLTSAVRSAVGELGGDVRILDETIGYIRATVPPGAVEEIARHRGVAAVALSITGHNYLPNGESPFQPQPARPTPDAEWLRANPYRPQRDLGLDALREEHPTFDGRGITVAVLDGFVDPLLPDFLTAVTTDGQSRSKLVDQVNATDPRDRDDPFWIDMSTQVLASDDGSYSRGPGPGEGHLPSGGAWRVGRLDERTFADNFYLRGDLNRDGNPLSVSREFTVAWNTRSGEVWLDADQDGDLRDEQAMRDYRIARDVGALGRDRLDTVVRDSVGYTVTVSLQPPAVSINLGYASHGTEIAGAIVATRSADGLIEGTAPGAALINYWHGSTTHGLIEGALRAFRDERVDLLVIEQNVFLTMDYALDDGRSVVALLLDRMAATYGKPAFAPASNIPGPGQMSDVALGAHTFAVGAYESRASWWTFDAARVAFEHNVSTTGSHGPAGTGRLKPDFVSPVHAVTPNPAFLSGGGARDLFELPPGRAVCGGTSCATPLAAGVAASLLSGARQSGVALSLGRLRWALTASALPLDLAAHAQGAGLLQAHKAWQLVVSSAIPPAIEVVGTVETAFSRLGHTPLDGPGTYIRQPVAPVSTFRVMVRRLDGPSAPQQVALRWHGPASFDVAPAIALPLGAVVPIDVTVTTSASGIHSGVLVIADPVSGVPWHLSLHAIVGAERPEGDAAKLIRRELTLRRPGLATVPIAVGADVGALDIRIEAAVAVRAYIAPPDRKVIPQFTAAQRSVRHVLPHPAPGVYYVSVWNGTEMRHRVGQRTEPENVPVTITAAAHQVTTASSTRGVVVTNHGAAARMSARTTALIRRQRVAAHVDRPSSIDLEVPEGAEWLLVEVVSTDPDADVDVFLFQCPAASCGMVRAAMSGRSSERVFVARPRAGRWRAVLDTVGRPAPVEVTLDLADPAIGAAVVDDGVRSRGVGSRWSVQTRMVLVGAPSTVVARIPVVADDLDAMMWTAPASLQGMGLTQSLSWFPLAWIEPPTTQTP